ncbi:MAG: hypothetical protein IJF92_00450 [Bacilli bacterium]|nr:hypothetical protein [Bacilli bacterium]MBQ3307542.1 hypothetical protein [Bacilli bacterium]MBQ3423291.1 hypothetical protein [Romboutsia sp.]
MAQPYRDPADSYIYNYEHGIDFNEVEDRKEAEYKKFDEWEKRMKKGEEELIAKQYEELKAAQRKFKEECYDKWWKKYSEENKDKIEHGDYEYYLYRFWQEFDYRYSFTAKQEMKLKEYRDQVKRDGERFFNQ